MDDIKVLIGKQIRSARNHQGWTAKEASERASAGLEKPISTGRWQNWECGMRTPGIALFPHIAKVLGTTPEYLAGWSDEKTANNLPINFVMGNPSGADPVAWNINELKLQGLDPYQLALHKITDNAMQPDFTIGDHILFDTRINEFSGNGIYALEIDNEIMIRNIRRNLADQSFTVYVPDQRNEPDQVLKDFDTVKIAGKYTALVHWANR